MTERPLTIDRPLWTASCPTSRICDTSSSSDPHLTSLISTSLRQVEAPTDDAAAILPECYYSEPFFRHELASVFGRSWICVGRASQLDDHYGYIDYRIADRRVLVVRGESGSIEAVSPVCRHRGAIAEVRAGLQGTKIVCPYHKWTYGPDGALLNAPLMPMSPWQRARFGLRQFRCEIWLGWVFVSFDDHAPALSEHLAEVERQLHPWRIDAMVPVGAPIFYECAFNWKIACDNQGESYHLVGSHAKSVLPYVDPSASQFTTDGRSYVRSWFPAIGGPMGPAFGSRLEGVRSDFNGTWSYNVFPNHMFVVSDDFVVWQQQVIVGHGQCRHMLQVLGHADVAADPMKAGVIDAVRDGVQRVEDEDQASFRQVWAGLMSGDAQSGPFARSELGTLYFQQWLMRKMTKASENERDAARATAADAE